MKKKVLSTIIAATMLLCAACTATPDASQVTQESAQESNASQAETEATYEMPDITTDRAGNAIEVPSEINRIVSLAPSTTQVLIELGLADKIVGIDYYSADYIDALDPEIPMFDMMSPDCETIASLEPDIVFTSGMSSVGGVNPFTPLVESGFCVADIPSSESIESIKEDLLFIGAVTGTYEGATGLVDYMDETIATVEAAGEGKTVLFLMSIPDATYPTIYSFGNCTYMQEMLDCIGAVNVFEDEIGWISVSEEDAIATNPDVILTNVNWVDDPVSDILALEGWENVTAIVNGDVYYVDANLSSRPNEHIADAIVEWAGCISASGSTSDDEAA
ncbi:MAG: ABC transporter substrate-binding protein [Saccharofermentans sp.]|nr:ABC transporter substrate-binding protein [Saccharofermentans sp.]